MRIRGTLTIEGIKLHVDIDALDHERELVITNVHPSRLVIPRERWKIEYLGLSDAAVEKLRAAGIATLDNLLDSEWSFDPVGMGRVPLEVRQEVERSLTEFKEIALIFEMPREGHQPAGISVTPPPAPLQPRKHRAPPPLMRPEARASSPPSFDFALRGAEEQNHQSNGSGGLEDPISVLGLPKPAEEAISVRHRVTLIRELAALSREDLIMTPHVDTKTIDRIEKALAERGLYL